MRYLCVYKPGTPQTDVAPSQREMAEMGKLIGDMTRAGVLLGTGSCQPSEQALRLEVQATRVSTAEGPFADLDHIAGYCLMQVKSRAEAVEWGKRFLAVVQQGRSELFELAEFPQPAA